ncbi:MAG: 3'-5' exonuclease [bacterium]|nr:3'-5' exonuclease [bacterium]
MKLIFLDTETTGIDVKKDRLCQLCYYKVGEEIKANYYKPPFPIPVGAMSVHHITNEMVAYKPPFQRSPSHEYLKEKLADHVMVAHNADFDAAILGNEGLQVPRKICTLRVARYLDDKEEIPEYKLQYLRYHFGLVLDAPAHDAKGDVIVLYAVFGKLLELMMKKIPDEESAIEEMVRISSRPTLVKRFKFGKYKGSLVSEVATTDRGYLEWLLKEKIKTGEENSDISYTLKEYLK